MIGLIAPALLAAVVAFALGGSARGWSQQHVRWSLLATLALLAQAALFFPPLDSQPWVLTWGAWLWVASMLGVLAMLLRNAIADKTRLRVPWMVAALGVAANILVVSVNGGAMPRSVPFAADAPGDTQHLSNVVVATSTTRLIWLGDIIAEPAWLPLTNVLSVGDLLLSMGLAGWIFMAAFERRPERRPHPETIDYSGVPPG